jgi:EAL domain-containing protein (putative c-di-GMP-specific phosphodiesterase class I)
MLNNMESSQDIVKVMCSIMGLYVEPLKVQGQEFFVTASAGIAVYPEDGDNTDTLLKNADIAVNRAKEKGKNQSLFCSEDMKEETRYKARLSNDLYRALDRGELMVYYQPQISLKSQRIVGAEALLRWFHPQFGLVSPGVFIPLAEKTGLIGTIGDWVLRQACAQASAWQAKGLPPIRMAANISANQLHNPQFAEQLRQMLEGHHLDPDRLELEVTESVAIREPVYIIGLLNQLKQIGVQLSIDDFGTEYSSLSRLKQLPVDRIKIDMQFVQGMEKNEKDLAITKVFINLAKSLRIKVIAEGVENIDQLVLLGHEQCDGVEGFYYYKPMPAEELEKVLAGMKAKEMEMDEETIA